MSCNTCSKAISPSKTISCNVCTKKYHATCTELKSVSNYNQLIEDKNIWKCLECKTSRITTRKNLGKDIYVNTTSKSTDLDNIKDVLNNILSKIEELTNSNKDLEKSVNYCSDKIDSFDEKLKNLSKITDDHENRLNIVEKSYKNITSEFEQLKSHTNYLEQRLLENTLEISGIPPTTNENLYTIIDRIATELKIDLTSNHIQNIHRITYDKNKSNSKIIVQLTSVSKKNEFISNAKQRFKDKISLTANNIHNSFKNDPLYLNAMLTTENRKLLWLSKLYINEYSLKYAWANRVYLSRKILEPKQ
ncbi:hypothetical protein ACI65C_008221 [Semiaphis heraclei]